ncbi:hypothetical protein Ancab_032483 [Ancistrocladus abbreviatus]
MKELHSENIDLDEHEFVEMMVVDGCFVLELFRKVAKLVRFETDDPIASMQWVFSFLLRDLLRLENQQSLFVLEGLWEASRSVDERECGWSLVSLRLHFFKYDFEKLDPQNCTKGAREGREQGHGCAQIGRGEGGGGGRGIGWETNRGGRRERERGVLQQHSQHRYKYPLLQKPKRQDKIPHG